MKPESFHNRYLMGGPNDRLIKFSDSAAEQTLPAKCIGIIPNPGCAITSLKRSDDETKNWADNTTGHLNCAGVDLTDKYKPIFVEDAEGMDRQSPMYWTKVTLTAGDFWAITE